MPAGRAPRQIPPDQYLVKSGKRTADAEFFANCKRPPPGALHFAQSLFGLSFDRETHDDGSSLGGLGFEFELAAMGLDDPRDQGQPQTGALGFAGLEE